MNISVFDLFKVGIGPSSSHTMGPMCAAADFVQKLLSQKQLSEVSRLHIELFGSLGATGQGHGSGDAVILGLEGNLPQTVELDQIEPRLQQIRQSQCVQLAGQHGIAFNEAADLIYTLQALPQHPNGMRFRALSGDDIELFSREYFSIGGGFILDQEQINNAETASSTQAKSAVPYPFESMAELLEHCQSTGLSISDVVLANECTQRDKDELCDKLFSVWQVMQACIQRGCTQEGVLPGRLAVKRRAPELYQQLTQQTEALTNDSLSAMDWVNLYALAVNEENAAGGRVVTAPTNGAAGIVPAVLSYFHHFYPEANNESTINFLLTAAAVGMLCKRNASISGAEVGCQGEVGSACAMAAAGLTAVSGGTPQQIENAAEIAMEHNLGLTCDPIAGLVQIPCIERNAMASIKAINASRLALKGDGKHLVSLDKVIQTMRDTGADMQSKYKETSLGGLAVNVIEC